VNAQRGSVGVRLVVAASLAVAGVVALQQLVEASDRREHARPVSAAAPASALAGLGFRVQPTTGVVKLASRMDALAPDVAPVLQVLDDGSLAVRRPPRVPSRPPAGPPDHTVAVLFPRGPLAGWSPTARGALAELLAALTAARPLPRANVDVVDVAIGEQELLTLLDWLP
jgi:hypothetical protein